MLHRLLPRAMILPLALTTALLTPGCFENIPGHDAAVDASRSDSRPDGPARETRADLGDAATPDLPDLFVPTDVPSTDVGEGGGPLRVATFNCHCLLDNPATRAKGIALEIVRRNPDVIGLQEICQTTGSPGDNFADAIIAELKIASGRDWQPVFAQTHLARARYDEGIGLLAPKGTIVASGEANLPFGKGPFPRKVVWARLATPRGSFYFYSTHLTTSSDSIDRLNQATAILALAATHASSNLPQVVVGDFNDVPDSLAITQMKGGPPLFTDSWSAAHPADLGLTCCDPDFHARIDYVFVRSTKLRLLEPVELAFDQPYGGVLLSDHKGLFVAFTTK